MSTESLPCFATNFNYCNSCLSNKIHRLPFGVSSVTCVKPLEILYIDVWGHVPIDAFDHFQYHIVFVYFYTKYIWLYLMKKKLEVTTLFNKFKSVVEKYFNTNIITVYSDGRGKYISLNSTLTKHGIQHLKSPPHTPQLIGTLECRHRHIVKTGLTLLHHASLTISYWFVTF